MNINIEPVIFIQKPPGMACPCDELHVEGASRKTAGGQQTRLFVWYVSAGNRLGALLMCPPSA